MNVYSEALELLAATPDDTTRSELWANTTRDLAGARSSYVEAIPFIQFLTSINNFTSPHLRSDPQQEAIVDKWLAILKEVPVEESPYCTADGIVVRDGKRLSTQLLLHTYYAERIDTIDPTHILEIGAGFGGLARILATKRRRSYTILDLPGSLFCSWVYLKTHFPDRIFTWCLDADDLAAPADFKFVPARLWQELYSYRFDMAVNTCSLGEMLPENRDNYLDLIDETCGYFYSHNRESVDRVPSLSKDCVVPAVVIGPRWQILFDETEGKAQTDPDCPPSRELLVKICER